MFKFSFDWLRKESDIPVEYDTLIRWLEEQGFEIASITDAGTDKLIEIEVKANRPDMLSIEGVLREFYAGMQQKAPKDFTPSLSIKESERQCLSAEIRVNSPDVHRYYAVEIRGIDNTRETPLYIRDVLTKLGVNLINPAVDISNYVLLLLGQPIHIFDADKLDGAITIANTEGEVKYTTLAGSELTLQKGALLISDEKAPLCLAGIIGAHKAEVDCNTKNIIIESANFDHIIERVTSKKQHVTTMASYRFERGVDVTSAERGARKTAELVLSVCGGDLKPVMYAYKDKEFTPLVLPLTVSRTNALLGTEQLNADRIASMLRRCYFEVEKIDEERLSVTVPAFRLDVDGDYDLIEEVGRIYGYHNIEPKPIEMTCEYEENVLHTVNNHLRNAMVGYGFIECLTYGFIPTNAMQLLRLEEGKRYYGDITILNPLSNLFGLMRPTLVYNLITTVISNMAIGKNDFRIFESGRVFFREKGHEDGYNEHTALGGMITGNKLNKGFGLAKEVKFSVYDAVGIVDSLLSEYNIPYRVKMTDDIGFFQSGFGAEIYSGDTYLGCVGKVSKDVLASFENGKLVRDDLLYFELIVDRLTESKRKITFETSFPSVKREYNLSVKNGVYFADYKQAILSASPLVVSCKVKDVYKGVGVQKGSAAVLISVEYNAVSRTLEAKEIEDVEKIFLEELRSSYDITLKL